MGARVRIVVDTSVIIAAVVNEPSKAALVALTAGADLLAPPSLHWEVGNAFSAMLRRGRMTLLQAIAALQVYRQIYVRLVQVDLGQALAIASDHGIYAYEAYMIQCARDFGAPLLTLDRGLRHAARAAGVKVLEVDL